jgi:hypothetical protein
LHRSAGGGRQDRRADAQAELIAMPRKYTRSNRHYRPCWDLEAKVPAINAQGGGANDDEKTPAEHHQDLKAHLENMRAVRTRDYLWQLVKAAREQLDPATWHAKGGPEAEDFLVAVEDGRPHPLLLQWRKLYASHHPAPSLMEQNARNHVVSMCAAFERAMSPDKYKLAAQKRAARAVKGIFPTDPTPKVIEHWQRAYAPNEWLVTRAIELHGINLNHIELWFVGLVHNALGSRRPVL